MLNYQRLFKTMAKKIPTEALIILNNQLSSLPARSKERRILIEKMSNVYGISTSGIYRALQKSNSLSLCQRSDYNIPITIFQEKSVNLKCCSIAN